MNFYTPKEVAENTVGIGKSKGNLSTVNMFLLGILAGMMIAFAGAACTLAGVGVSNATMGKLIGAMIFPGGLAMVLIAGSELFTGNSLMIMAFLQKEITLGQLLKNWFFVYIGNLIGGMLVAGLLTLGHCYNLFDNGYAVSAMSTAATKCSLSFSDAIVKGILCNMLVCLAVWISFAAKDITGKLLGVFFPVTFFVFCGFEHSVADMYFLFAGFFTKLVPGYLSSATAAGINTSLITLSNIFLKCLLPVTVGNMIGGLFIGTVYWVVYLKK